MPYKIYFNEIAHHEYKEAFQWYESKQKGLGIRFENHVESCISAIADNPQLFAKKKYRFREAVVKVFPYSIVYEIIEKENIIHIAAIYHSKRNPKKKFRRRK